MAPAGRTPGLNEQLLITDEAATNPASQCSRDQLASLKLDARTPNRTYDPVLYLPPAGSSGQ
jgi:hypothetical protein